MDNDVLHKTIAYGLFEGILKTPTVRNEIYGVLGTAKYVVGRKLKKHPPLRGIDATLIDFNAALQSLNEIEPTQEEVKTAAQFEYMAQRLNLAFDNGESILCAVLLARQLNHILTGDKRAIVAVEMLVNATNISNQIGSKLICLEQLFLWFIKKCEVGNVRAAICSESAVDKALTSCFGCYSPEVADDSCVEGLKSYIDSLRKSAPTVLMQDD